VLKLVVTSILMVDVIFATMLERVGTGGKTPPDGDFYEQLQKAAYRKVGCAVVA
jgi:hypothetical protein